LSAVLVKVDITSRMRGGYDEINDDRTGQNEEKLPGDVEIDPSASNH